MSEDDSTDGTTPRQGVPSIVVPTATGPTVILPQPSPPSQLEVIWANIPALWKAVALMIAMIGAGSAGTRYLDRYATQEALAAHVRHNEALTEKVTRLELSEARRDAIMIQVQKDVGRIVTHLLGASTAVDRGDTQ